MLILDGDLEASLLLIDMLWAQLAPKIPGELIAAVPGSGHDPDLPIGVTDQGMLICRASSEARQG
jgi:hypothetical protein